jgi:hypothetical protein
MVIFVGLDVTDKTTQACADEADSFALELDAHALHIDREPHEREHDMSAVHPPVAHVAGVWHVELPFADIITALVRCQAGGDLV